MVQGKWSLKRIKEHNRKYEGKRKELEEELQRAITVPDPRFSIAVQLGPRSWSVWLTFKYRKSGASGTILTIQQEVRYRLDEPLMDVISSVVRIARAIEHEAIELERGLGHRVLQYK